LQEIKAAGELAKEFTKELGENKAADIDAAVFNDSNHIAFDVVQKATEKKFYSQWMPKALGGQGWHPLSLYSFNLEMASYCLGITNLIGAHYVGSSLVTASGAFRILKRIIQDIKQAELKNDSCVLSVAITEPMAGSDLEDAELLKKAQVCTLARKIENGFLLKGQKIFISNSALARWHIVTAFEDLKDPAGSLMVLAVPANSKGVSIGRTEKKLGQAASPTSVVFFEDVFVPQENVCFSREQFKNRNEYLQFSECLLSDVLALSRAGVGAMATGVLKKTLEILLAHCENHTLDGKKLVDYEWVQSQIGSVLENFLIAKTISWEGHMECYSRGVYKDLQKRATYAFLKNTPPVFLTNSLGPLMASELFRKKYQQQRLAQSAVSNEKMISGWGSLVKMSCSDLAFDAVLKSLEIVGSSSPVSYFKLEKILRDVKLLQIYEGTNDLNLLNTFKNFSGPTDQMRSVFQE